MYNGMFERKDYYLGGMVDDFKRSIGRTMHNIERKQDVLYLRFGHRDAICISEDGTCNSGYVLRFTGCDTNKDGLKKLRGATLLGATLQPVEDEVVDDYPYIRKVRQDLTIHTSMGDFSICAYLNIEVGTESYNIRWFCCQQYV